MKFQQLPPSILFLERLNYASRTHLVDLIILEQGQSIFIFLSRNGGDNTSPKYFDNKSYALLESAE